MFFGRVLFVSAFANRALTELFCFSETCEALAKKAVPAARTIVAADIVALSLGSLLLLAHDAANAWRGAVIDGVHMEAWVLWGSLLLALSCALATYLDHGRAESSRTSWMATASEALKGSASAASEALTGWASEGASGFSNNAMQPWLNVSLIGALLSFMVLEQ